MITFTAIFAKGYRTVAYNSATDTAKTPLVPIPRTGVRGSAGVFLFLMFALASAAVGVGLCSFGATSRVAEIAAEIFSAAACALLIVHTWRIGRRAKAIMPVLIVVAVGAAYLSSSFLLSAVLLGLVCGMTSGSLLLSLITRKQAVWLPLVPIAAYAVTLLFSGDPIASLSCLLPLPAAWALSHGTHRSAAREDGPGRVGVICLTSVTLGLTAAALLAIVLYRHLGSLSLEALTGALESARESVITWILTSAEEQIATLEPDAETLATWRELFSRETVEAVVNSTVNLLPGYAVVLVNLMVTVAQLILHAALVTFGCGESLSDRVRVLHMSSISCIVFAIAYVLVIITGGAGESPVGTVVHNIYLILVPGLAFSGLLRLVAGLRGRRMGCLTFGIIFLSPLLVLIAPMIPAVIEVVGRFVSFLSSRLRPPEDGDIPSPPPDGSDSDDPS